jgi:hypothetical protein
MALSHPRGAGCADRSRLCGLVAGACNSNFHRGAQINVEFQLKANQTERRAALEQIAFALSKLPEGAEGALFETLPPGLISAELKHFPMNDGPLIFEVSGFQVSAPEEPGYGPVGIHLSRIDDKIAHYRDGWGVRAELLAYPRWGMPFSDQMHRASEYLAGRFPGGIFTRGWIYELNSHYIVACAPNTPARPARPISSWVWLALLVLAVVAAAIRQWRPWEKSTGPQTVDGKRRVSRNAYRGRRRAEFRKSMRQVRELLREQDDCLSDGSGGYGTGSYNSTGTITTPGGYSTYAIPYSVSRNTFFASYWVKQDPSKVRLGVRYAPLTDALRRQLQRNTGVVAQIVMRGAPAFGANILEGDVLLKIGGEDIVDPPGFAAQLTHFAGQTVTIDLLRGDQPHSVAVKLNKG